MIRIVNIYFFCRCLKVLAFIVATEWHAFGFGLKEGLWFWKRTLIAWDKIKKMEQVPETEKTLSPELIEALKQKYHYYIIGFALPEDCALLGCVMYLVMANAPALAINPNDADARQNREIALNKQTQPTPLLYAPIGAIVLMAGIAVWSRRRAPLQ